MDDQHIDSAGQEMPEYLLVEARELLAHYYDHAYLSRHPMLQRLKSELGDSSAVAVRGLRKLLLDLVERLRPAGGVPQTDAAWRPYAVIQKRYILCMELDELQRELNLGVRQLQREQRRAIESVAAGLWERLPVGTDVQPAQVEGEILWREISLAVSDQEVFDVAAQLRAALAAVQALAQSLAVDLAIAPSKRGLEIRGIPSLFRQLMVGALSFAIRQGQADRLSLTSERQGGSVVCSLCLKASDTDERATKVALPDTLFALAKAQNAQVSQTPLPDGWRLELRFGALAKPCTVMIVEDNADMVALFARYLAREGYHLVGVTDSTVALDRMRAVQPDAIVLDVMMRALDGWELLQRIKADPRLAKVPLVMCSILDEAELAASLGADAYLRKPIRPLQLLECLASLCR